MQQQFRIACTLQHLPTVTCDPPNAVRMCRARRGSNSQDSLEQTLVRGPLLVPRTRLHDTGAAKQRQDWPWPAVRDSHIDTVD
jgi:hypothetical protein